MVGIRIQEVEWCRRIRERWMVEDWRDGWLSGGDEDYRDGWLNVGDEDWERSVAEI